MQLEVISLMELPFSPLPPNVPTFSPFLRIEQQSINWKASYGNTLLHIAYAGQWKNGFLLYRIIDSKSHIDLDFNDASLRLIVEPIIVIIVK